MIKSSLNNKRSNEIDTQDTDQNSKQIREDPNDGDVTADQLLLYVSMKPGEGNDIKTIKPAIEPVAASPSSQMKLRRLNKVESLDDSDLNGIGYLLNSTYDGFTLKGKKTLKVAAPRVKLCRTSFLYSLSRGKLVVSAATPNQETKFSKIEGQFQTINVWTYRGTNKSNPSFDDDVDYVYCGSGSSPRMYLKDCYIRLQDLQLRIYHDHDALDRDYDTYSKYYRGDEKNPPFPVWTTNGQHAGPWIFDTMYSERSKRNVDDLVESRIRIGFSNFMSKIDTSSSI
ncbi:hypothetical protein NHQ30_002010 [Ciborinia camelliae]|nr:hypothetical protein NHQ30_002010 [Ciborinia camelliae]